MTDSVSARTIQLIDASLFLKGGPGSGNWGHRGRKGKRGGSIPSKAGGLTPVSAGFKDVQQIRDTAANWKKSDKDRGRVLNAIADDIGVEQVQLWKDGKDIVGAASWEIDGDELSLYKIATAPGSKGVGSQILQELAKEKGVKKIYALPIGTSAGFFEKVGFTRLPEGSFYIDAEQIA